MFYLKKKEVHVSKSKALLSHRKKWEAKESEQEVVLAQTQTGEYNYRCTKGVLSIN